MIDKNQESFTEEADELLAELETSLLELEESPEDPDLIGRVFRCLHTIKGLGAMCGFHEVSAFTHKLESVFDKVRYGEMPVTPQLVTLSLASLDRIRSMLSNPDGCCDDFEGSVEILAALQALVPAVKATPVSLPFRSSGGIPLRDYLGVMTEYELSRLKANLLQAKKLFSVRLLCSLDTLDTQIREFSAGIKSQGELISSIPDIAAQPGDGLSLRFFFTSSADNSSLEQKLGVTPERVDAGGCFGLGEAETSAKQCAEAREVTYRIRFRSCADAPGSSPDLGELISSLRRIGACQILARTDVLAALGGDEPASCVVRWDITLTTAEMEKAIVSLFSFVGADGALKIEVADSEAAGDAPKRLGELLVSRGEISTEDLCKGLARQKQLGQILVEDGVVPYIAVEAALNEQQHIKEIHQERQIRDAAASIRVPTHKLDLLVNLVGELVTVQARLGQLAASTSETELLPISEEVEHLVSDLRDNALSIRMLPIGSTFAKFQRMVRDLSLELGKDVELFTAGAETELDKTVIERLNDPLVHLIRNCLDHGIESKDTREAAGKPAKGTVRLAAAQCGDSVEITVEDDGGGLDREAIRAIAIKKGLVPPTADLTDKDISAIIFAPGLSTALTVSNISGRGVGMDVVKRSIESLRGTIEVSTMAGKGTTITMRIPLTLAIVESLLVAVGADRFVLPLALVEECVELSRADITKTHGRNIADVRGKVIPYISLRELFRMQGAVPEIQQIIITRVNGSRIGFVVDSVIGEHQTVIKPLGRLYRDVPGISGATILGNGCVALILDPPSLLEAAEIIS